MLAIKLRRIGRSRQPSYRLIVAEKRSKVGGKYVEDLGWYNPKEKTREFRSERVKYWLGVGVKPTDTAHNLLVSAGIINKPKIAVHNQSKEKEEEKSEEAKSEIAEKQQTENLEQKEVEARETKPSENIKESDSSPGENSTEDAEQK